MQKNTKIDKIKVVKKILFLIFLLAITSFSFSEEKIIDLDGVKIFYLEKGKGKQNLILIHGFAGSSNNWTEIIPYLVDDFKIYVIDLPGFGNSDKPLDIKFNVSTYADYLLKFIDKLKIEKPILCGNSLGGAISAKAYLKDKSKIDKLILIDPAGHESNLVSLMPVVKDIDPKVVVKSVKKFINDDFYVRASMKMVFHRQDLIDKLFPKYADQLRKDGVVEFVINLTRSMDDLTIQEEELQKIEIPTLIIWGEHDKVLPVENADYFKKNIKDSQLVIIKDAGHLPQEERPEIVVDEIKKFLK